MKTIRPSEPLVVNVATWSHYVAWAGGSSGLVRTAYVYDLDTGQRRVVARSRSAQGELDYVVGGANIAVYTDLAQVPTDDNGQTSPWVVSSVDLVTGAKRVLASSRSRLDERNLPFPHVTWPWMVDVGRAERPSGDPLSLDVYAVDLRSGKKHTVVHNAHNPAAPYIAGGKVIYGADSGQGRRDLFVVPIAGSKNPRKITRSGKVAGNAISDAGIAWEQPLTGDPTSLWLMRSGSDENPVRFANGGRFPMAGKGFMVWLTSPSEGQTLVARQPCSSGPPVEMAGDDLSQSALWAVLGDRVVWATVDSSRAHTTIHVARVVAG